MPVPGSLEVPWPDLYPMVRDKKQVKMEPLVLSVGIVGANVVVCFQVSRKRLELTPKTAKAFAELIWRKAEEAGG